MKQNIFTLTFFFTIFLFSSCSEEVLPPQRMKKILWDMMVANQWAKDKVAHASSCKDSSLMLLATNAILDSNHVSERQFRRSYQYYLSNPDKMMQLLDSTERYGNEKTKMENKKNMGVE